MRLVPIALAAAGAISLLAASMPAQARPRPPVARAHVVVRHPLARRVVVIPRHPRRVVILHPRRRVGLHIAAPGVRLTVR